MTNAKQLDLLIFFSYYLCKKETFPNNLSFLNILILIMLTETKQCDYYYKRTNVFKKAT